MSQSNVANLCLCEYQVLHVTQETAYSLSTRSRNIEHITQFNTYLKHIDHVCVAQSVEHKTIDLMVEGLNVTLD